MTKDVIRSCLIEEVLEVFLAIRAKCPHDMKNVIFIQQDNAKPHIEPNDPEFLEVASSDGFNINISCQLPNSPDMNVLYLGLFRPVQSLQHQEAPSTLDDLVNAIEKAFQLGCDRARYCGKSHPSPLVDGFHSFLATSILLFFSQFLCSCTYFLHPL